MCPACLASGMVVVAAAMSTGGLAAVAAKLLGWESRAEKSVFGKEKEKEQRS